MFSNFRTSVGNVGYCFELNSFCDDFVNHLQKYTLCEIIVCTVKEYVERSIKNITEY